MRPEVKAFADRLIAANRPMGWLSPAGGFKSVDEWAKCCDYIKAQRGWR